VGEKSEKQSCEHQGQRRRRGRRCSRHWNRDSSAAHRRHHAGAGRYFLKKFWRMESPQWSRDTRLQPVERIHPEAGKSVRRTEYQRQNVMD